MSDSKHTPGPWALNNWPENPQEHERYVISEGASYPVLIADCYADTAHDFALPDTYKEACANARLIAAAPDLLTALRDLTATARTFRNVPKREQEWTPIDDTALEQAFTAIEKAEGNQ